MYKDINVKDLYLIYMITRSVDDIVKLAATMDRETFPPGEVIVRQGNKGK